MEELPLVGLLGSPVLGCPFGVGFGLNAAIDGNFVDPVAVEIADHRLVGNAAQMADFVTVVELPVVVGVQSPR